MRRIMLPLLLIAIALGLSLVSFTTITLAAPQGQATPQAAPQVDSDGQEYIVQAGDSLYQISGQFYGQPAAYQVIIAATNVKAATDSRFTPIADARFIQRGQLLWIPNAPDQPIIAPSAAATPAPTATVATTTPTTTDTATTTVTATLTPTVRFVSPTDGATVAGRFVVTMAAIALTVEPAGAINPAAGHFHILVDTDFVPAGDIIINDTQHIHYGKGQLTTTLELAPGEHVLRLQFANGAHVALDGPQYQDTITVTVATTVTEATTMDGPGVRFVSPADGAVVPSKFDVTMMANELTVEPAGEINPDAGHFHILVDTDFVPAGDIIINDTQHIHYGKGQLTTTLELAPGEHVLRLQFANGAHVALDGPQYQDTITVTVATTATDAISMSGPGVRFVSPANGAVVPPKFGVTMMANELTVEPAGEINPDAGHFHILVDTDFVPAGDIIINDAQHIHYGKGQLTTTLELEPGEHVLRLQFANGAHVALDGPQYQDTITVTVASDAAAATSQTAKARVYFVSPTDGATVDARFDVVMAAAGLIVEPSGKINPNAGHFHILVDTDFVEAGETIITDDQHLHFGKGQAVAKLELPPGEHVLRLQFANGAHIALAGPQYRDEITVMVAE